MSGQWKPGDVGIARLGDGSEVVVIRTKNSCHLCATQSTSHWHGPSGNLPGGYPAVRPLIVLDPEADRDVARVENALEAQGRLVGTSVQAALRSLVAPPRPDEPTGLGAVVEAIHDNRFVRVSTGNQPWQRVSPDEGEYLCAWDDIAAVRVLSEGVQ